MSPWALNNKGTKYWNMCNESEKFVFKRVQKLWSFEGERIKYPSETSSFIWKFYLCEKFSVKILYFCKTFNSFWFLYFNVIINVSFFQDHGFTEFIYIHTGGTSLPVLTYWERCGRSRGFLITVLIMYKKLI